MWGVGVGLWGSLCKKKILGEGGNVKTNINFQNLRGVLKKFLTFLGPAGGLYLGPSLIRAYLICSSTTDMVH